MLVKLTYFKPSGKYYSSGEYETKVADRPLGFPRDFMGPALFEIWEEVARIKNEGRLPDLIEGHSNFTVLIDVPDHPHRHPHIIYGEIDVA